MLRWNWRAVKRSKKKQSEILSQAVLSIHREWHPLLLWEGEKAWRRVWNFTRERPELQLRPISRQKLFYFPNNSSAWKDHPLSVRLMPLSSIATSCTQLVQRPNTHTNTHTHSHTLLILTWTSYIPAAPFSLPVISLFAWQHTEGTHSYMNIACKRSHTHKQSNPHMNCSHFISSQLLPSRWLMWLLVLEEGSL